MIYLIYYSKDIRILKSFAHKSLKTFDQIIGAYTNEFEKKNVIEQKYANRIFVFVFFLWRKKKDQTVCLNI